MSTKKIQEAQPAKVPESFHQLDGAIKAKALEITISNAEDLEKWAKVHCIESQEELQFLARCAFGTQDKTTEIVTAHPCTVQRVTDKVMERISAMQIL